VEALHEGLQALLKGGQVLFQLGDAGLGLPHRLLQAGDLLAEGRSLRFQAGDLLFQAGLFLEEVRHPLGEAGKRLVQLLDAGLGLLFQGLGPGGLGLEVLHPLLLGGHVLGQGQEGERGEGARPKAAS
jgi:hypothetical protein